jgi:hypothetical protein
MLRVPATRLHQGRDEAPHRLQVDRLAFLFVTENRLQQRSETSSLRIPHVHLGTTLSAAGTLATTRETHLHIMRTNLLVPRVASLTVN